MPYLPFVFAGMLPWNLFAGALQRAGNSLVSDSKLISKVYFPRMAIPVASSIAVLVDFFVALVVMFVLLPLYGIPYSANLLLLPLLLVLTLVLAVGVSLFLSALNVYYRDFMYALPFLMQVWMYASPVVYSADLIPGPLKARFRHQPHGRRDRRLSVGAARLGRFPGALAADLGRDERGTVHARRARVPARRA